MSPEGYSTLGKIITIIINPVERQISRVQRNYRQNSKNEISKVN